MASNRTYPEFTPETILMIMKRYGYTWKDCCEMPLELLKFLQENVTGRFRDD